MTAKKWQRVNHEHPCPVCGKTDWCGYAGDQRGPTVAVCMREDEGASGVSKNGGYIHRIRCDATFEDNTAFVVESVVNADSKLAEAAARFAQEVDPESLSGLADDLGVSAESLKSLGVGWASQTDLYLIGSRCRGAGCWACPMCDGTGKVIGIHLRTPEGFKYAVTGSKNGLFIPKPVEKHAVVLAPEGLSDAAALLSVGLSSVGRPSAQSNPGNIIRYVRQVKPEEFVVVADNDKPGAGGLQPGIEGANQLAANVSLYAKTVKVIAPPAEFKDVRAWVRAGARRKDILESINAVPAWRVEVSGRHRDHE